MDPFTLGYLRAVKARLRAERSGRFARKVAARTQDLWWAALAVRFEEWLVWSYESAARYAPDQHRYR